MASPTISAIVQNPADALKLITLLKGGGIYRITESPSLPGQIVMSEDNGRRKSMQVVERLVRIREQRLQEIVTPLLDLPPRVHSARPGLPALNPSSAKVSRRTEESTRRSDAV